MVTSLCQRVSNVIRAPLKDQVEFLVPLSQICQVVAKVLKDNLGDVIVMETDLGELVALKSGQTKRALN